MIRLEQAGHTSSPAYASLQAKVASIKRRRGKGCARLVTCLRSFVLRRTKSASKPGKLGFERARLKCFRWLKQAPTVPSFSLHSEAFPGVTTNDPSSALRLLVQHWRKIWDRRCYCERSLEALKARRPRAAPVQPWSPLSLAEVKQALHKQKGKSAGGDGWSGTEVADLPDVILEEVLRLFQFCVQEGRVPDAWKVARQCHIPKQGAGEGDTTDAAKLRPVTALSVWYRSLSRALLQTRDAQQWLQSWWPPEAIGGKKGSSVYDALLAIDEACCNEQFLVSLDLSLAFDTLHPRIAIPWMQHIGLPPNIAQLLDCVWSQQRRILLRWVCSRPSSGRVFFGSSGGRNVIDCDGFSFGGSHAGSAQ